ncbi:DUF2238 domain-containing protein [bacterium]|nr:DUF2238 domain-containing protein [bacterium]
MNIAASPFHFIVISLLLFTAWSGYHAYEPDVWLMEAAPVLIAFAVFALTQKRFPFTPMTYWLLWIGAVFVLIGAHYTYARMPLFEWLRESWQLQRNPYDRVGHFVQGFVPAIFIRELIIRTSPLKKGCWVWFLALCFSMAKSATYELAEWAAAITYGKGADDFLALQGDPWDAQQDMLMATLGAGMALLLLSRRHDQQLEKLAKPKKVPQGKRIAPSKSRRP